MAVWGCGEAFFRPSPLKTVINGVRGEGSKESKPYKKGYAVGLRCGFGKVGTPGEIERSFNASLTLFGMTEVGR